MGDFEKYAANVLGIRIPEEYAAFMEKYGKKLAEDPVTRKSFIPGLGNRDFVVGTTQAFRAATPGFSADNLVIGWLGLKTVVVNKVEEEIDDYVMLDSRSGKVLSVDMRGVGEVLAADFDEWVGSELLRANLKEKYGSILTVIMFDDRTKAEKARENLFGLQKQGCVELEDAVVVIKEQDGQVKLHQAHKLVRKGGLLGSVTGLVVGGIFFGPLVGAVFGGVAGALSASFADLGIDDQFMKDLSRKFEPGGAALFTLVRKADPERVKEAFFGFGGKVLMNSWSKERESLIQSVLDAAAETE